MAIDRKEAAEALGEIEQIAQRVRQSRLYNLVSLILIWWGGLIFAAYLANWLAPRQAGIVWLIANGAGVLGTLGISVFVHEKSGVRTFDWRVFAAFVMLFAFGLFWSVGIARLPPRELNAFWPTFFMLFYSLAGLWLGAAFLAIGLGITVLTLVGYFLSGGYFELWMAVVNGLGLMLGGYWMRRN